MRRGTLSASSALAAEPPAMQKQIVGQRLRHLIAKNHPEYAERITNKLLGLDCDIQDLFILLEPKSEQLLKRVVDIVREEVYREEDNDVGEQDGRRRGRRGGRRRGRGGQPVEIVTGTFAAAAGTIVDIHVVHHQEQVEVPSSLAEVPDGHDRSHGDSDVGKVRPAQAS